MYTIIVGREGNQPFPILEEGVSRQHLQVVVPNKMDDEWIVQDLNSANGTFVQQKDGTFERVSGTLRLTWDTVIRMGPANMYGRTFWLCQLTQTDANDFSLQFGKLNRQLDSFIAGKKQQVEDSEKQKKRAMIIRGFFIAFVSITAFVLLPESMGYMRLGALPIAGVIAALLFNESKNVNPSQDYKAIFRCPNGKCGRPLTEYDIRRAQCPACKAHM